eukprot:CAMPEP_0180624866 /NCGR_PEP_ID=MMETSP1037_2-20121125/37002_1 /TAXON_ID=632150 /ORGANISM="Azadinium spinosum, Strain 3D9" /LENGTH=294 /DNA_ID=CAMNT_0022645321 /DNA_START=39 /DNA_END=920 /DNA_ORIENTATION=-
MKKRDISGMQAAIEAAKHAGLAAAEISDAEFIVRMAQQASARLSLKGAVRRREISELRAAIQCGKGAGLTADELKKAEQMLCEEERKVEKKAAASLNLRKAIESPSVEHLESAIREAAVAGLVEEELAEAKVLLQRARRQIAARSGLVEAMRSRNLGVLRAAIAEGKAAGLRGEELKAVEVLHQEERKAAARLALEQASKSSCIADLEKAIAEASADGLGNEDVAMTNARAALSGEKRKIKARSVLEEAILSRNISRLKMAIAEAIAAGLTKEETCTAESLVCEEQRKMEARTR